MTVRVYKSTDGSAPQITNANGSLIAILKACLVNGYGSATAAGWTNPYNTSTTLAVFRSASPGNQRYLRVSEAAGAANVNGYWTAFVRGYEAMTAVSTGTGPFPTTAQKSGNGLEAPVSLDSYVAQPKWVLVATETAFHFYTEMDGNAPNSQGRFWSFGDFPSYKSGDVYNTMIMANENASVSDTPTYAGGINSTGGDLGRFWPRGQAQTGTSQRFGLVTNYSLSTTTQFGNGTMVYPHAPDSSLILMPLVAFYADNSPTNYLRGTISGLWDSAHVGTSFTHLDTFSGATGSTLAGKTFLILRGTAGSCMFFETSNTW